MKQIIQRPVPTGGKCGKPKVGTKKRLVAPPRNSRQGCSFACWREEQERGARRRGKPSCLVCYTFPRDRAGPVRCGCGCLCVSVCVCVCVRYARAFAYVCVNACFFALACFLLSGHGDGGRRGGGKPLPRPPGIHTLTLQADLPGPRPPRRALNPHAALVGAGRPHDALMPPPCLLLVLFSHGLRSSDVELAASRHVPSGGVKLGRGKGGEMVV